MEKIKKSWAMISYNFGSLVGFEFLFKLLSLIIFSPLFIHSFNLIMKLNGFSYLTLENLGEFLGKPLTLILLLVLVLFMMVYTMFDITTIIIILDESYHKRKIKVIDAIRESLIKCKSMLKVQNIVLAFFTLFVIPFLNIGIAPSFISTIKIPEFILEFIEQNRVMLMIFFLLNVFLLYLLLRWIYAIHYYVLEGVSFREARRRSITLSCKNHVKDLVMLIVIQICSLVAYFLFIFLGIFLIFAFNKILGNVVILKSVVTTIIGIFIAISFMVLVLLVTPISYAGVSSLYYLHKEKINEKIADVKIKASVRNKKINRKLKMVIIVLCVSAFLIGVGFTYGVYMGKYNLRIEYIRNLEVTAHRGASVSYPENTMSAFKGAKRLDADWIELDVQQTLDGEIVVSHDINLTRTAGVNKNIYEMTYDEIKMLDVGSYFGKNFKGELMPTLDGVIEWAKDNGIKLNIELKPTGHEKEFEARVIELIKNYDFQDMAVVASQNYSVLENIKKIDKSIRTLYVMSICYGDILRFDKADSFSVEASNINSALVKKVHRSGKEIYAWTINSEDIVRRMIDLRVDNIITDNISMVNEVIMESKTSNLINEYIKMVENIF